MAENHHKPAGRTAVPLQAYAGLTDEELERVDLMLMKGEPPADVVRRIQQDFGKAKDVSPVALDRKIRRYKDTVIAGRLAVERDIVKPEVLQRAATLIEGSVDAVAIMEDALLLQQSRVQKLREREGQMPVLLSDLTKNMELMFTMARGLTDSQMDLGIRLRQPKKVQALVVTSEARSHLQRQMDVSDRRAEAAMTALKAIEALEHDDPD